MNKIYAASILLVLLTMASCKKDFYDTPPLGQLSAGQLKTKAGVQSLLVASYAQLKGSGQGSSPMNWLYGDLASDDGTAGIAPYDDDRYLVNAFNGNIANKWSTMFEGINRCNDVLRIMAQVPAIDDATRKTIAGETRFLRGYYYFELRKIFHFVPYIDESTVDNLQPNDKDIFPQIEADFLYASQNLPATQTEIGRANSWAAKAFLAKTYLYQGKYADALPILTDVINNGVTSSGEAYGLMPCYRDAFDVKFKNNQESVFAIQMSIEDGSGNANGNGANRETYPRIPDAGLFYGGNFNATQNLVDAFKTDADGLPLFNTFSNTHIKNDDGILSADPYDPDTATPVDPRLDWTVSRRGIPYLGWGINPGVNWNGGYGLPGGSLFPVKNMFTQDEAGIYSASSGDKAANSSNYVLMRFADVLLMAAECEVEAGSLQTARTYINRVRERAKNGCYVMSLSNTEEPASNYQVGLYNNPFPDQDYARTALRFERRLEFGLEGQRHFDLVRWGIADQVINPFLKIEGTRLYKTYMLSATFQKNKNEYSPIPQKEIINSSVNGVSVLKQNDGY